MPAATSPSVRKALLARLLPAMLALVLAGSGGAWLLADYFLQRVLDQWLYDEAVSLGRRVQWDERGARVTFTRLAQEIVEWDVADRVYYEVVSERHGRLIGNAVLPEPRTRVEQDAPVFFDGQVGAEAVRATEIRLAPVNGESVLVKVAWTRRKAESLARAALFGSLAMFALLVAASVLVVWFGITRGMASLEQAVRRVRAAHHGRMLQPRSADEGIPIELLPLVEEIDHLVEELSAAHASQERFVIDAAHQLRTPLASLQVQLEVARREQDPVRHAEALALAAGVLGRTGHLVHQLLTLAKVDERRADTLVLESTDIDAIAREEVERFLDRAVAAGADLGYFGPERPVRVAGKDALLREVVANLLDNALRYGGRGVRITVGVETDPPQIWVEDDGPGIAASELQRVGRRFYRIPGTVGEGCGLGLAIVGEIARRHGASFDLAQAPGGKGLRASLGFPPPAETGGAEEKTAPAT